MDVVFDGKASINIRKTIPDTPEEEATIISVIKDWTRVPYILGGQSYPMVDGTNEDRVELAAPIDQKIFFAGEATDITGEFGTISGALKSGERAAEEVVAAILEENSAP
jgi:monoamine oxidase